MIGVFNDASLVKHGEKQFYIRRSGGYRYSPYARAPFDGSTTAKPEDGQTIYAVVDIGDYPNNHSAVIRGYNVDPIATFSDRATAEAFRDEYVKVDPHRHSEFLFRGTTYEVQVRSNERSGVVVWEVKPTGDNDA